MIGSVGEQDTLAVNASSCTQRYRDHKIRRRAANSIYPVSFSAAFAALVQAIEVLAAQPGPRDPCPYCQHDRSPGATSRFKDLLAAIGVDRRTSDSFYQIRSGILHGSHVLLDDIDGPFSVALDPGSFEFYTSYDTCEQAARFAMLTWPQRHASTAT